MFSAVNFIYYQFKSEKQEFKIDFETTEISIFDIKRKIVERRNMNKFPEKFELLFYDQDMTLINKDSKDDNIKIQPHTKLFVKRVPYYMLSQTFKEVIYDIKDKDEFNTVNSRAQGQSEEAIFSTADKESFEFLIRYLCKGKEQPLFNKEAIKSFFTCKHCYKSKIISNTYLENYADILMCCCGESLCEKCIEPLKLNKGASSSEVQQKDFDEIFHINTSNSYINHNFDISNIVTKCKVCEKENAAFVLNKSMIELRNKLFYILNNSNLFVDVRAKIGKSDLDTPSALYLNFKYDTTHYDNLFKISRFFIIKSSNVENILTSQMHNEWATTVSNQKKINEAFQSKDYIILVFSANKSRSFQGFAVMTSFVSDKIASYWTNENGVNLGGCFSVQWLVTCELPFQKVSNIINPLNNESVIKSRDTTELTKEIGVQICQMCLEKELEEISNQNRPKHFNIESGLMKVFEDIKKNKDKWMQKQGIHKPQIPIGVSPPVFNSFPNSFANQNVGGRYPQGQAYGAQPSFARQGQDQMGRPQQMPTPTGPLNPNFQQRYRERSRDRI